MLPRQQRKPPSPCNPTTMSPISPITSAVHSPDALARWLAEADNAPTNRLWRLLHTPRFADLWYGAREAGERLRAWALTDLYARQSLPGGAHPDPREPSAFSNRAVLARAAHLLSARVWLVPDAAVEQTPSAAVTRWEWPLPLRPIPAFAEAPLQIAQIAWLLRYPERPLVDIAVRACAPQPVQQFAVACMLGYLSKERARLCDPEAPAGAVFIPRDPGLITVLHQFAIALLALPRDCPDDWPCDCNRIRARFNAPPPDHEQPSDALTLDELRRALTRHPRDRP